MSTAQYDVVIHNGCLYDGLGGQPVKGGVAIQGDEIAAVGEVGPARGQTEIDAGGLAVAPGFINMLSWANASLLVDGRSQGDVRQGVTLEVMGEGWSMGPLDDEMRAEALARQGHLKYDIPWTTLGGYLDHLARRGVSANVASFVGAATVRIHTLGYDDRPPAPEELARMQALVGQAMEEGAMGLSSALIYPPGCFAADDELVALARIAADYGGLYISHIRNEGTRLLEEIEAFLELAQQAGVAAEIYHLKASGRQNWPKMAPAIARIEAARAAGQQVTADVYTYAASSTGLAAAMPPWVQEGGHQAFVTRLQDPDVRARVAHEMLTPSQAWDSSYLAAGSPDKIMLVGFKSEELKPLTGQTLAQVAAGRGRSPEETAIDLIVEDDNNVGCVYFTMSQDNVRHKIAQPWISFGSDGASMSTQAPFLESSTHPRAYGNFSRLLGRYVRDEGLVPLPEAIRRLTSFPAANLKLRGRGVLAPGYYADVVVFDPEAIEDRATFEKPHQYATGVAHVLVNGVPVLRDGEHTGAMPGRVVRGPGWRGWRA
ncbi:MAG: D-aminoacylase [Anaerolineae bacterium]|jgi:N-acyl-D-amino-acid deacylase